MFEITPPPEVGFAAVRRGDEQPLIGAESQLVSDRAVRARRSDVALGRTAARQALEEIGFDPVPILRGSRGEPLWPPEATGSITHGAGWGLALVAPLAITGGIGIDLESEERFFPELPQHIAFDSELDWLMGVDGAGRSRATLELFSVKEAIYKAFAPRIGLFFGFDAVTVEKAAPDMFQASFRDTLDPVHTVDRPFPVNVGWWDDLVVAWLVLPPDTAA